VSYRVAQSFDKQASVYGQRCAFQSYVRSILYEKWLDLNLQSATVLELGVGPGMDIQTIRSKCASHVVIGQDLAYAMCQKALANGLPTVCSDAHHLPFQSGSYTSVLSNLMLQWVDIKQVFSEVYRVLKPKGIWMATTLGPGTLQECRQAFANMGHPDRVNAFLSMQQLAERLSEKGFYDLVLEQESCTIPINQPKDCLALLRDWGANVYVGSQSSGGLKTARWLEMFSKGYPCPQITFEVIFLFAKKPLVPKGSIPVSALRRKQSQ
jgi:malonyl-CoA O-methyltransferase